MEYLTNEWNMDLTVESLFVKAERLQEQGRLKQALLCYQNIVDTCPECTIARENIRIVQQFLQEESKKREANSPRSSGVAATPSQPNAGTVIEMDVHWFGWERIAEKYFPDPNELAFETVHIYLSREGYGHSPRVLVHNETLEDVCNSYTEWQTFMRGRARFQVTLVPDKHNANHDPNPRFEQPQADPRKELELELRTMQRSPSGTQDMGASTPGEGYGHSPRVLVHNETLENSCSSDTEWQTFMRRYFVRVHGRSHW